MKLTLEQLRQFREYRDLTNRQKLFMEAYITNGEDRVKATLASYRCKNEEVAKSFSHRVIAMRGIVACMVLYYNDEQDDHFAATLLAMIKTGKITTEQVRAAQLYADVKGYARRDPHVGTPVNIFREQEVVKEKKPRVVKLTPGPLDEFK